MTPPPKTRRPSTAGPAMLAVDVGNSEITLGVFQDDQLVLHWRLRSTPRTPDETRLVLRQLIAPEAIDLAGLPSALCSVVPAITTDFAAGLTQLTGIPPVLVSAETVPSMPIRYADPSSVGPDRIANALAARELVGAPAIVVDLGTATTFDVVGEDGDFLGGAITPGMMTSADELFRRAARLGRVELTAPEHAIGTTTAESLRSGIVLGHAALVDGMVSRILAELGGRAAVVATGGLARLIEGVAGTIERIDETLTLHGLRLVHESVARPETLAAWVKKQETRRKSRAQATARMEREAPAAEPEDDEDEASYVVHGPTPRRERNEPPERPERPTRPERAARPARPERAERAPRAERPARAERPKRVSKRGGGRGAETRASQPAPERAPAPVPAPAPAPRAAEPAGDARGKRRRGRRGGRRSRR